MLEGMTKTWQIWLVAELVLLVLLGGFAVWVPSAPGAYS
jgi:hypothetical protein